MERFVIIVNGWKPLIIITKRSILDLAAALDPPLMHGKNILIIYHYEVNCNDAIKMSVEFGT